MTRTLRWAWVALFLLLGFAAVLTNMNSKRILVLHEGKADSAGTLAFDRGVGALFKPVSRLKWRHQYLGFDLGVCQRVLEQLKAFNPDAVIAEGARARQCLEIGASAAHRTVVSLPEIPTLRSEQRSHVDAWARLLSDVSQPGQLLAVLHGADPEGLLESQLLAQSAALAGLRIQWISPESAWTGAIDAAAPDLWFVGRTVLSEHKDAQDLSQTEVFRVLRSLTTQPILASRLESLALGADLVLLQAPEQRGEWLAHEALGHWVSNASPPTRMYEMAVGLRNDFVVRQAGALPSFYPLSARLAGFLFSP